MGARVEANGESRRFVVYSDQPGASNEKATHTVVCDWQHGDSRETRTLGLYVGDNPDHQKDLIAKGQQLISQVPNLAAGERLSNVRLEKLKA